MAATTRTKPAKKAPSKVLQKKAKKAKTAARTQANKSKVRVSRTTRRQDAKTTKTEEKKSAPRGRAPHSARITPVRGPMAPLAARTAFVPKHSEDRKWLVVDAANQTVGRLATEIAMLLRGKHKPTFTPNNDAGDFVIVINADQIKFKSTKEEQKEYYSHTGFIGGLKTRTPQSLRAKGQAGEILRIAVKGMVPRSPLGRVQMGKLNIYNGGEHPHKAQTPVMWQLRHSV